MSNEHQIKIAVEEIEKALRVKDLGSAAEWMEYASELKEEAELNF